MDDTCLSDCVLQFNVFNIPKLCFEYVCLTVFSVITITGVWLWAHEEQNQYRRREEIVSDITDSGCSVVSQKSHHSDSDSGVLSTYTKTGSSSNKLNVKCTEVLIKATDETPEITVTQILSNLYSHQKVGSVIINQPQKDESYRSKGRLMSLVDKDGFHIDNLAYALIKDVSDVDEDSTSNEKYIDTFRLIDVFDNNGSYIIKSDYEQNTNVSKIYRETINHDTYISRRQSMPMGLINKDGFHIDEIGCELENNISVSNEECMDFEEDFIYSVGSDRSNSYGDILKECSKLEEELNSPIHRKIMTFNINEFGYEFHPDVSSTEKESMNFENNESYPKGNYTSDCYGDISNDCSKLEEEFNSCPTSTRNIISSEVTRETYLDDTNVSFEGFSTPLPFDNYLSLVRLDSTPYD